MQTPISINVHPKENIYFILKIMAGILGYFLLFFAFVSFIASPNKAAFIPLMVYLVLILLYLFFRLGFIVGHLKGNAIKVTEKQFPEIYKTVTKQCQRLGMSYMPDVYILQSGGILNAFATQFLGSNYIVIFSEILDEMYQGNIESVEFVIGHELGHIKRNHITKSFLLFPAFIIPFLNRAYSRACEYTCDNIGGALSPNGVSGGLLLLASGKQLWRKIDKQAFIEQQMTERGFWYWFAEKMSTHPHLSKRLMRFKESVNPQTLKSIVPEVEVTKKSNDDHSSFLPKL